MSETKTEYDELEKKLLKEEQEIEHEVLKKMMLNERPKIEWEELFKMPTITLTDIYSAAKNIKWTEEELKKPPESSSRGIELTDDRISCGFYNDGNVAVFDMEGNQICWYRSYIDWNVFFNANKGVDITDPEAKEEYEEYKPEGPYLPRAFDDHTMYYLDGDGRIFVYTEESAVEYMRNLVDVLRKAYIEGKGKNREELRQNVPEIKKFYEIYDGKGQICNYKDYDTFMIHHITSDSPTGPHILWVKPGEDENEYLEGKGYREKAREEVMRALRKLDETKEIRNENEKKLIEEIIQMRKNGKTKKEIAEELEMGEVAINNILKIHAGEGELRCE